MLSSHLLSTAETPTHHVHWFAKELPSFVIHNGKASYVLLALTYQKLAVLIEGS